MRRLSASLNDPRRVAATCGIVFIVLFVIGGPVLQGQTPTINNGIEDIRAYWRDDGDRYLVGDFIFGIAVLVFFLPFVVGLRSVLEPADPSGGMWARVVLASALAALTLGGAGAAGLGVIGLFGEASFDDSTLRLATGAGAYSTTGLGLAFAVMLTAAAIVIAQTGVLWRWLAVLAVAAAIANIVGALWVPDRDQEGAFAMIAFIGVMASLVWVLAVSVQLLLPRHAVAEPASAASLARA